MADICAILQLYLGTDYNILFLKKKNCKEQVRIHKKKPGTARSFDTFHFTIYMVSYYEFSYKINKSNKKKYISLIKGSH